MEEREDSTKLGAGTLAGMARMGVHELRNAVYADSNVAQRQPEYGVYGNSTPQEIVAARAGEDAPNAPSALEEMHAQAEAQAEVKQPAREMDKD